MKRNCEGFTLVEAVLAMFVLVTGLAASLYAFGMAARWARMNGTVMAAMHSARGELERLAALAYDDPALATGTGAITNGTCTGTYIITEINPDVKSATVTLNWDARAPSGSCTYALTTLISRNLH